MADRTSVYNFLYSKFGDKWYPGFDYENMLTIENEIKRSFDFIGPGVIDGWTVEKLSENRSDQLSLISSYINNFSSDTAQRFVSLGLAFTNQYICAAGTTSNITLIGGAPNSLDGISLSLNDKILVKNQSTSSQNGIYYVSTLGTGSNGTWTRDSILDSSSKYNSNFVVYVSSGVANTSTVWVGAISGTAFTINTTNLYFDNAFKQCIKVFPGSGIVDSFAAKTELNNYFRLTKSNDYYVWAESLIGTKKDEICKISCPFPPDYDYDLRNNATYLATVSCGSTSLLYDFPTVNTITYDDKKQNLNDLAGEFQESLRKSYLAHKHLGNVDTASKINLTTDTILDCVNSYNSVTDLSSTIFILKNTDGSIFEYNSSYGIPKVYLDNIILLDTDYVIDFDSTPCKIYLKNSIESSKKLSITLPNVNQKSLFIIDSNGNALTGSLAYNVYYQLSDGTLEYRNNSTTSVYKNFSWNRFDYLAGKVYIGSSLQQVNFYVLDPDSGTIVFQTALPTIGSYNIEDVSILVDSVGAEIVNNVNGSKLSIDASAITKGTLPQNKIKNFDHNSSFVFNTPASFKPSKYLIQTSNRKYYYPENTSSDLQYNTKVYDIYQSQNLDCILYGTNDGLFSSDNSFKSIKNVNKYLSDYGYPTKIIDNLLTADLSNYFNETFILTNLGYLYSTSSLTKSWTMQKSPLDSNGAKIFVNDFVVSTDKIQTDVDVFEYYKYLYAATDQGVFTAKVLDGTAYENWDYSKINEIKDIDDTILTSVSNINSLAEIVTENRDIIVGEPDLLSYDRSLYVGADGLYAGTYQSLQKKFNGTVNGIYWIKTGTNNLDKNNLLWWDDSSVYITHTARYIETASAKYWQLPFSVNEGSYTNCSCATTSNITLSGLSTIDGYTLSAGDRVLVKNQTDKTENGIYVAASGSWSRASDLNSSSEIIYGKYTVILNGTSNSNSAWFIRYASSYTLGSTDLEWDIYYAKVYTVSTTTYGVTPVIKTVVEKLSNQISKQYIIAHSEGLAVITESGIYGSLPSNKELIFDAPYMGNANSVFSYNNSTSNGITIACTDNGIYQNTELLWQDINNVADIGISKKPWIRTENMVLENDELSIFDVDSNIISGYTFYNNFQLVSFDVAKNYGTSLLYEREYKDFYINPWTYSDQSKPRVTVYINSVPTNIPFTTDNNLGLIRFINTVSLQYINSIKVSIARNDAYLSNVGVRNHNEILSVNKKSNIAISKTFQDLLPGDSVLYITSTIPTSSDILLITDGTNEEILYVNSVDNSKNPVEVSLKFARTNISNITFLAGSEIYSISKGLSPSIETDLYKIKSKLPYDLTSLNDLNTLQLGLSLEDQISGVFDVLPAAPFAQTDTRGLKNTKLVSDFVNSSVFDETNSEITYRTEFIPTTDISDPVVIYAIENFAKDGNGLIVATDKGIWEHNGSTWIQKTTLDNSKKVYYLKKLFDDTYIVGTEKGLWTRTSGVWTQSSIFTQQQLSYSDGVWGNYNFNAYGKSDGFSFVKTIPNTSQFISDNANIDNTVEVYGLYKSNVIKIVSNVQTSVDTMLLFTNNGIYSVIDSANSSTFSPTMISREMLGDNKPSNIKYYKAGFRPLKTPKIPAAKNDPLSLFVLTDNGLLRIKNWQWCYPDNTSLYSIEETFLSGIDCNCYVLTTSDSPDGVALGKSKIFIGSDKGVYRSFDEGNSFFPAERFNGKYNVVNDLKIESTTYTDGATTVTVDALIASTNDGIWYSIDDGDTWYKTGDTTIEGYAPVLFDSDPSNSVRLSDVLTAGNMLAQTFVSRNTNDVIDKVSVYLDVDDTIIDPLYQNSLTGNIVRAYLYSVVSGLPNTLVATSTTTYSPSQIQSKDFVNFEFNYSVSASTTLALVITESLSSSCISVMRWKKSNESYSNGNAISKYSGSWANLYSSTAYDFYFKIHYTGSSQPEDTNVAVGYYSSANNWDLGTHLGTISKDDGSLTLDTKFLISLLLDDTASLNNFNSSVYKTGLKNLLSEISNRTTRTVGSDVLEFTAYDVWLLSDSTKEKTSKFENSYDVIDSIIDSLAYKGKSKNIQEALFLCMNALNPNSVVQLNSDNTTKINNIISYLSDISALRLSDLQNTYDLSTVANDWDGTSADIPNSENATRILLEEWAKSYTPLLIVLTDNSDFENLDIENYIKYTNQFWYGLGFKIIFLSVSDSTYHPKYLPVVVNSNGNYYLAESSGDWSGIQNLLMHGGLNEIFKGTWTRNIDFNSSKFISSVNSTFTAPSGSSCTVEFRYSTNRKTYSSWISLTSGSSYSLKKNITNLDFRINMSEGWSGSNRILPSVSSLYYVETQPASLYYYTDAYEINGVFDEYILAENITNNENIKATWGICRGNSTNWDDFEIISSGRDGILNSRQKSIQFDSDGNRFIAYGESTTTNDFITYFVRNGSWSYDSKVVVYVNNSIVRNIYSLDRKNGCVIFDKKLSSSDLVTVYIQFSKYFRIGLKLDKYISGTNIINFGLQFTTIKNFNKYSEYSSVPTPQIEANKVNLIAYGQNLSNSPSVQNQMYVDYNITSSANINDQGSLSTWYINKGLGFVEINSNNGYPNYANRITQRIADLDQANNYFETGDIVKVEVQPYDGFKTGVVYSSESFTLVNKNIPYVSDVQIKSTNAITNNTTFKTSNLTAYYTFTDIDNSSNHSLVKWYDLSSNTLLATGSSLGSSYLSSGQSIYFTVLPYDGEYYGLLSESQIINII